MERRTRGRRTSRVRRVAVALLLLVVGGVALLASPMPASAGTLTLDAAQLVQLWDVFETPENPGTMLTSKTTQGNAVVFFGGLADTADNPFSPFAQIGLGANFRGVSSTGSGSTVSMVLGSHDVRGYDRYALTLKNLGRAPRSVSIFLTTGFTDAPFFEPANFYQSGFVRLDPDASTHLVLDFDAAGVVNRNHASGIGFQVGGDVGRVTEPFRIQVGIVPTPATASLVALATAAVILRGRLRRPRCEERDARDRLRVTKGRRTSTGA